jgi:hypothetical protein
VVSTPNPSEPTGSFSAVSCTSASACTAVGYSEASNGSPVLLAERWNGTAWAIQRTPSPDGSTASYLRGVSCPSASACTAVGFYTTSSGASVMLAERWNGTAWAIQPVPGPSGFTNPGLYGVSCPSASACTAVGFSYRSVGSTLVPATVAERWNGTAWAAQSTPSPGGANGSGLYGVSCPSASACTAVGFSIVNSLTGATATVAERWNGTAWATQSTPSPGLDYVGSYLQGVSCTSASACTAVGTYSNGSGVNGTGIVSLAERWNGTAWATQSVPSPGQGEVPTNLLEAVSCASASACTAVGQYTTSAPGIENFAVRWNGTAWAVQAVPGPDGILEGVSCPSASTCTAAGSHDTSDGALETLAESWNGTAWVTRTSPNRSGAKNSELNGVSCPSASACTAVGSSGLPGGYVTLAERWNGTAWSVQPTPNPSGATTSVLQGVSCSSASACTAVGSYYADDRYVTLAERWNGTAWSVQATPNPSSATDSYLEGVSCSSASACTAVGSYYADGEDAPLAERWNGTAWSVQATPSPSGATDSYLEGVSCSSASACTAVGYDTTSTTGTGGDVTLAERWNGTAWSVQTTPSPSADPGSYLSAVSCPSASSCTAVGHTSNYATETWVTLAERWNGTAWSVQATPNPSSADGNYSTLAGVSCTSAGSCTAVGSYNAIATGVTVALAERWNGTAWSIQPTPNASGAVTSYLYGVSCTSASACMAAGRYETQDGLADVTLAERYS